jgi:phage FluMu gp28-like protein
MNKTTPHSIDTLELLPYQSAFAANTARFKIGLWARQTGKDHTATAEAVLDCYNNPGTTWIIVAAGERQALESLAKAREWAKIIKLRIEEYNEAPGNVPYSVARSASTGIKWSNGSRLLALPANPATIRGYSANLILTEFAFHENPDAIWRAIYPTISNPLRGGVKKLRIISTPNGLTNKFAHLWHSTPNLNPTPNLSSPRSADLESAVSPISNRPAFATAHTLPQIPNNHSSIINNQSSSSVPSVSPNSVSSVLLPSSPSSSLFHRSRITIHDAIADGLPLDPIELQAGLNDPEAWAQEYLCEFMDNSTVLLPYDLIESCESSFASELSSPEALSVSAVPGLGRPQLFAGLDFARKNHLTVCWILERIPTPALNPNLNLNLNRNPFSSVPSASSAPAAASLAPRRGEGQGEGRSPSHIYLTREVHCLRNLSTPDQIEILRSRLKLCQRICLDYTGPGIGLGDYLHREFGGSIPSPHEMGRGQGRGGRLELCTFTSAFKAELFPRLVAAFESRELLIPIGRDIREDLHSIYRTVTNSGQVLYRAHSTPDGHADRTTALALALRAAQAAPQSACASSIGRKYRYLGARRHSRFEPPTRTLAIIY